MQLDISELYVSQAHFSTQVCIPSAISLVHHNKQETFLSIIQYFDVELFQRIKSVLETILIPGSKFISSQRCVNISVTWLSTLLNQS